MGNYQRPNPTSPVIAPGMQAANRNFELKSEIHRELLGVLHLDRLGIALPDGVWQEVIDVNQ